MKQFAIFLRLWTTKMKTLEPEVVVPVAGRDDGEVVCAVLVRVDRLVK